MAQLNAAREANGLAALPVDKHMTAVARTWSETMAADNNLRHNPNFSSQVNNWQLVGENVGVGPSADAIHNALMDSPDHRANILGADWTHAAVGAAVDPDGRLWVTQLFRQATGSSDEPSEPDEPAGPARETSPTETAEPGDPDEEEEEVGAPGLGEREPDVDDTPGPQQVTTAPQPARTQFWLRLLALRLSQLAALWTA